MRQIILLALVAVAFSLNSGIARAEGSVRVSLDSTGSSLTAGSGSATAPPAADDSGNLIAFQSIAAAVVDDTNNTTDIFVRLLDEGTNELASVTGDGTPGNNSSTNPSMSGDGKFVAFQSLASDLVDGDKNGVPDIVIRDREAGITTRIEGAESESNGASSAPSLSREGQSVAFCSTASNFVAGDDNGASDLFLTQTNGEQVTRIMPTDDPTAGCVRTAISGDGKVVVFSSVVDAGDGRQVWHVYRHDVASGETVRVSSAGGSGGNGGSGLLGLSLSTDGTAVAFDSAASNLTDGDDNGVSDAFVWESDGGSISRVSQTKDGVEGNADSGTLGVAISGDGNWVVFASQADNLLPGDVNGAADIFRHDGTSGVLTLVSADVAGRAANGPSYSPTVSNDGSTVVFASLASNIAFGDRNKNPDVFLRSGDFPGTAGPEGAPSPTSPGDTIFDVTSPDDRGVPTAVIVGLAATGGLAVLAGGWYLLGRRPQA